RLGAHHQQGGPVSPVGTWTPRIPSSSRRPGRPGTRHGRGAAACPAGTPRSEAHPMAAASAAPPAAPPWLRLAHRRSRSGGGSDHWFPVQAPEPALSVWAGSSHELWMSNATGDTLWHLEGDLLNGGAWTAFNNPTTGQLKELGGTATDDVWLRSVRGYFCND